MILCGGPISPRDGVDTVILAVSMLHEYHGVDAMLVVIAADRGDAGHIHRPREGLELARLAQLAHDLDLARHIRFATRQLPAVVDDYHAAADVFASTPWHASPAAATAVAKAMACALPVVGAAAGAIPAMVRDDITGHLVPPRDAVALCRCLARLQRQPLLARAMGMAGQAHASATSHRKTPA